MICVGRYRHNTGKKDCVCFSRRVVESVVSQVIVDNASQRFENVRKDLRGAQASIVGAAAHDLEVMFSERWVLGHIESLVI